MQNGFTLMEVMLGTLILAVLATFASSSLWATFRTQKTVEERTELQDIGTSVIYRIREDLSQAFLVESQKPLTFFKGEDIQDRDRIEFTSLSHLPSGPDARECDQTELTYMTETDSENPSLLKLLRRETTFLDGQPDNAGPFSLLTRNVVSFNLEYHDGQSYRPTWNSREAEQTNRLPRIVRATLRLRDSGGREEIFETLVDIPMSQGLNVAKLGVNPQQPGQPPTPPRTPTPPPNPFGGIP